MEDNNIPNTDIENRDYLCSENQLNNQGAHKSSCHIDSNVTSGDGSAMKHKEKSEDESALGGPRFSPPVYMQRYQLVRDILEKNGIQSVVDFGSAECRIAMYLRCVECMEKITLVDLDAPLLEVNQGRIRPLITDYLQPRSRPLLMQMYGGSVAEWDSRLQGQEAVTLVEVIEHLTSDVIEGMKSVIFEKLKPRLVIITTPNSDFNQLFPNFSGFRHWDHKFEWSRAEFQAWCHDVCDRHSYSVEFLGVGACPSDTKHLGHCSQVALFTSLQSSWQPELTDITSMSYRLIAEAHHPHQKFVSPEEQLGYEVEYYVNFLSKDDTLWDADDNAHIPLERLLNFSKLSDMCLGKIEILRNHLMKQNFKLSNDGENVIVFPPKSSSESDAAEEFSSGQFSDAEDGMNNAASHDSESAESWD